MQNESRVGIEKKIQEVVAKSASDRSFFYVPKAVYYNSHLGSKRYEDIAEVESKTLLQVFLDRCLREEKLSFDPVGGDHLFLPKTRVLDPIIASADRYIIPVLENPMDRIILWPPPCGVDIRRSRSEHIGVIIIGRLLEYGIQGMLALNNESDCYFIHLL